MDGDRFDRWTVQLVAPGTRRGLLGALIAGVLGLARFAPAEAVACRTVGRLCRVNANCCSGLCAMDATGRRTCHCQAAQDCPQPATCHTVACQGGACVTTTTTGACTKPGGTTGTCQAGVCRTCAELPAGTACATGKVCSGGACVGNGVCTTGNESHFGCGSAACGNGTTSCDTNAERAFICTGGIHCPGTACPNGTADCPPGYSCLPGGCLGENSCQPICTGVGAASVSSVDAGRGKKNTGG